MLRHLNMLVALTQAAEPEVRAAVSRKSDEQPMLRSGAQSSRLFAMTCKAASGLARAKERH